MNYYLCVFFLSLKKVVVEGEERTGRNQYDKQRLLEGERGRKEEEKRFERCAQQSQRHQRDLGPDAMEIGGERAVQLQGGLEVPGSVPCRPIQHKRHHSREKIVNLKIFKV